MGLRERISSQTGEGWITHGLAVLGGLASVVGIATIFTNDLMVLLAFVAGTGWALSLALLVTLRRAHRNEDGLREDLKALRDEKDTETGELRRQISEWRTVATHDSETLNRFVSRATEMPVVQPRRQPLNMAAAAAAEENEE